MGKVSKRWAIVLLVFALLEFDSSAAAVFPSPKFSSKKDADDFSSRFQFQVNRFSYEKGLKTRIIELEKAVTELKTRDVLASPKARIYSGETETGLAEDYNLNPHFWNVGCKNLEKLAGKVGFINTFNTCVRLYDGPDCDGRMLMILPWNSPTALREEGKRIKSIGPCTQLPAVHHKYHA